MSDIDYNENMRSFNRRAKIIATIGPSSSTIEMIESLIKGGMNVARLNMSHGTHKEHAKLIKNIRDASANLGGREIGILMDLQGPKIRVDNLDINLNLQKDETWLIGTKEFQSIYPDFKDYFIPTVYKDLATDCNINDRVLFDDGLFVGKVIEKDNGVIKIKIHVGGTLKSHKGINLPDTKVTASSFNEKDQSDLDFGLEHNIDYLALSFVRNKKNVQKVKDYLKEKNRYVPIISKIENPEAIKNIDEIIEISDVIMVARGDMGVEVGNHLVPRLQKRIIAKCNMAGRIVITATQMLETMTTNATPSRAEASDVANAIWDGTDAVMLSGETAYGKYPIEAVQMMDKIVEESEKTPVQNNYFDEVELNEIEEATMYSATQLANKVGIKRIVAVTETGASCLKLSKFRPRTSILGVTDSIKIARRMCLYWGVSPFLVDKHRADNMFMEYKVLEQVKNRCNLSEDQYIIFTRGNGKFFEQNSTNTIKVLQVY